jgi:hypothetical protein
MLFEICLRQNSGDVQKHAHSSDRATAYAKQNNQQKGHIKTQTSVFFNGLHSAKHDSTVTRIH